MNNTSYTPGPWYIQADPDRAGDHPLHDNRFITSGGCQLGSPEWEEEKGNEIICKMTDSSKQKQNARLIAAAPELLEACKAILKSDGGAYDLEPYQSKMLINAIAKAEGR